MKTQGFPKADHICKKTDFQILFSEGIPLFFHPIKLLYRMDDQNPQGVKAGVVVPKKLFHHAVDRNRLKRLMREAFRLNRHLLSEQDSFDTAGLQLLFVYSGHGKSDFKTVDIDVKKLINNVLKHYDALHIKKKAHNVICK